MVRKSQIIQAPVVHTQPSKPQPLPELLISAAPVTVPFEPDPGIFVGDSTATPPPTKPSDLDRLRLVPPPREPTDIGMEIPLMENVEGFLLLKKERRVGWKFYIVGPEPYPMEALTWIRKDQRAKESIGKVGISFNIMGQTQVNFCLVFKELATWAGI
jgi:hypothetical protein